MSKFYNVLCINDNEVTLWIQKQIIENTLLCDKVYTFLNGQDGLDFCKTFLNSESNSENNYPRLIFLDLHMPCIDGWEFLECFKNEIWPLFKETKIVISSFSIDQNHSERAKNFPFVIDLLSSSLDAHYLIELAKSWFPEMLGEKIY